MTLRRSKTDLSGYEPILLEEEDKSKLNSGIR